MKNLLPLILLYLSTVFLRAQETLEIPGLEKPVEILVDQWGVPHIYAQTEADLFFAQGFYAARDRLFQFEIWRRQATGTIAEILGPRELKRDLGTRLFQFRGDIEAEMNHYHERGSLIITSYVRGVNAYIDWISKNPDLLPIEFQLLGIKPQKWTPEVVISRHQGLLGNIEDELQIGRAVAITGADKVQELSWFHPQKPELELDPVIPRDLLQEDILELYKAYRTPVSFEPSDIIGDARELNLERFRGLAQADQQAWQRAQEEDISTIGSNNWIVKGDHTQSGFPMMANDPHRRQATPSLRYMAHLVGPGWNVIGGGEPEIPGISIGHNEFGSWGLTVFETDAEDLYVYQTNPEDPDQYWYQGAWEAMRIIKDTIPVKGQDPVVVELKYTRHGPVVYENPGKRAACAVRCGWLEIGGSPYLASLRMDQATDFASFREACNYSNIPGENMIWADRDGNIGWQAVGIAPVRRNWSGLVPVPGDGRYEWDGFLPIIAKPNVYNPEGGIFATANQNVTPQDYTLWDAIGYSWSDPYRGNRVYEVLENGRKHSLMDMARLQTDYLSIPARQLVPLLKPLEFTGKQLNNAKNYLNAWDFRLEPNSIAATIYNAWEQALNRQMQEQFVPENLQPYLRLQMKQIIDLLLLPDGRFGKDALAERDHLLQSAFQMAVEELVDRLGADMSKWQYGQAANKHILLKHPLANAVKPEIRDKLNVGPAPRGGNSYTVNNTSSNLNQSHGASFRIIVDTGNWDRCLATNTPGQSGDPDHKNYRNLFEMWAKDQFFPLFYSRKKVESVTETRLVLQAKR